MIVLVAQEKECHSFVVACELFACQNIYKYVENRADIFL